MDILIYCRPSICAISHFATALQGILYHNLLIFSRYGVFEVEFRPISTKQTARPEDYPGQQVICAVFFSNNKSIAPLNSSEPTGHAMSGSSAWASGL